jgi:hypothetical protein
MLWKENWPQTQSAMKRWWDREGLVVYVTAERAQHRAGIQKPAQPVSVEEAWLSPEYRLAQAEFDLSGQEFLGESFPYFDTQIGPGSLGTLLGSKPGFDEGTVWYWPCITDPDKYGSIRFCAENNRWLDAHLALIDLGLRQAKGRYLVGIPDLIENLDTLAALRGDTPLLFDLIERPEWVMERLGEINQAYFQVFDMMYARVKDETGGNAFSAFKIWGPGKTAKVQCDISATISAKMFRKFVQPHLAEQCAWLDYSLYHLDGTTCLQHVEPLLEIEALDAIEWTPQAGLPGGGSPQWYDLYRRIRAGGKGVQAIGVDYAEVIPLLDAVGPRGLYIMVNGSGSLSEAEALLKRVEAYQC